METRLQLVLLCLQKVFLTPAVVMMSSLYLALRLEIRCLTYMLIQTEGSTKVHHGTFRSMLFQFNFIVKNLRQSPDGETSSAALSSFLSESTFMIVCVCVCVCDGADKDRCFTWLPHRLRTTRLERRARCGGRTFRLLRDKFSFSSSSSSHSSSGVS